MSTSTPILRLGSGRTHEVFLLLEDGKLGVRRQLKAALANDRGLASAYVEGARRAAIIEHPGVVRVLGANLEHNIPTADVEYVSGETLRFILHETRRRSRDGFLPLGVVCQIGSDIAQALHHTHTLSNLSAGVVGMVHGDVRPSNIIVEYGGRARIRDFGFAELLAEGSPLIDKVLEEKLPYLAPEHLRQQQLDMRADIFCLGVVLYELLAGQPAFRADSPAALRRAVLENPVKPPSLFNKDVPRELDSLVAAALERDRQRRLTSMAEFASTLGPFGVGAERLGRWMEQVFPEALGRREQLESAALVGDSDLVERLATSEAVPVDTDLDDDPFDTDESTFRGDKRDVSGRPALPSTGSSPGGGIERVGSGSQPSGAMPANSTRPAPDGPGMAGGAHGGPASADAMASAIPPGAVALQQTSPDGEPTGGWVVLPPGSVSMSVAALAAGSQVVQTRQRNPVAQVVIGMVVVFLLAGGAFGGYYLARRKAPAAGPKTPAVKVKGSVATLAVHVHPSHSKLFINGRRRSGAVGPKGVKLNVRADRKLRLHISRKGHSAYKHTLVLDPATIYRLHVNLPPLDKQGAPVHSAMPQKSPDPATAGAGKARLTLRYTPGGAQVLIDGKLRSGKQPLEVEGLESGFHTITLAAPGYEALTQQVKLGPTQHRALEMMLHKLPGQS